MKLKVFALATLVAICSFANAQSVTVGFAQRTLESGSMEHQNNISVKTKAYGSFTADAGISAVQADDTHNITNRYELGLTYAQPLTTMFSADFRVAQGWKEKSGSATTSYYVLEPSVTAKIPATPVSVKVGYRVRNAWDKDVEDNSVTPRFAVGYDLTKVDKISLGRDWQRGDGALTQTTIQYTRAF